MKHKKIRQNLLLIPVFLLVSCGSTITSTSNTTTSNSTSNTTNTSNSTSNTTTTNTSTNPTTTTPNPILSEEELVKKSANSPFSIKEEGPTNMGLSLSSDCGIDQEKFNRELYPINYNGTIYEAADYGITPSGTNNSGSLSLLLAKIKDVSGNKYIKFLNSTYSFGGNVDATGINDLFLVGEKDTLFSYLSWGTYLTFTNSKNIFINSIQFDMAYSPTISGVIKSVTDKGSTAQITLDIPEEFDLNYGLYSTWAVGQCSYMECYFDAETGKYIPDANKNLFYNSTTSPDSYGIAAVSYNDSLKTLDITLNKSFPYSSYKTPQLRTTVSFAYTMYNNFGFHFVECENVTFENVTTYVAGGMGMRIDNGKNFYLNRTNFRTKDGSKRVMTCTADIIHSVCLEGDLKITNSTLEASHDDALNIKAFYGKISSVTASSKELIVNQTQSEVNVKFEKGDIIDILDSNSLGLKKRVKVMDSVKLGNQYTLTIDSRPNADWAGSLVGNDSKATHLSLDNCLIQNKRNRGILDQSRYSEIKNCTFRNICMGAIQVLAVGDMFNEAIMPKDIKIYNNKFINNSDDLSVFTYGKNGVSGGRIENIEIYNNFFYGGRGKNINLLGTENISVHNNLIAYAKKSINNVIYVKSSENINICDNVCFIENGDTQNIKFITSEKVTSLIENNNIIKGAKI